MTLGLKFKKIKSDGATKYSTLYLNSKVKLIINKSDIDDAFESNLYDYIKHTKTFLKGLDWIINSVTDHTINISNYNSLADSSYIKLRKE